MTDVILALAAVALVLGAGEWFVRQVILYRRRFKGRTFDPARPVVRRAGAQRVGVTGRVCPHCSAVTFGWGERCGRCKLPTHPTAESSTPLIAVAATPPHIVYPPSSSLAARSGDRGVDPERASML